MLQEEAMALVTPSPAAVSRANGLFKRIKDLIKRIPPRGGSEAMDKIMSEERSSAKFYKRFKARFAHATIPSLFKIESWNNPKINNDTKTTSTLQETLEEARKYYLHLFQDKPSKNPDELLDLLRQKQIKKSDATYCETNISREEVVKAIRSMANRKSPGPDRIPAEFYRNFEAVIADKLRDVYYEMHELGELAPSFLEGEIALIYKKKDPRDIRNYRPITCLNADYKILTKIIVMRLNRTLDTIIDEAQKGFVPKRLISTWC